MVFHYNTWAWRFVFSDTISNDHQYWNIDEHRIACETTSSLWVKSQGLFRHGEMLVVAGHMHMFAGQNAKFWEFVAVLADKIAFFFGVCVLKCE